MRRKTRSAVFIACYLIVAVVSSGTLYAAYRIFWPLPDPSMDELKYAQDALNEGDCARASTVFIFGRKSNPKKRAQMMSQYFFDLHCATPRPDEAAYIKKQLSLTSDASPPLSHTPEKTQASAFRRFEWRLREVSFAPSLVLQQAQTLGEYRLALDDYWIAMTCDLRIGATDGMETYNRYGLRYRLVKAHGEDALRIRSWDLLYARCARMYENLAAHSEAVARTRGPETPSVWWHEYSHSIIDAAALGSEVATAISLRPVFMDAERKGRISYE